MSAIWSTTIWKRTKPRVILDGIIFSDRLSVLPFVRPSVFQCGKNLQKEKGEKAADQTLWKRKGFTSSSSSSCFFVSKKRPVKVRHLRRVHQTGVTHTQASMANCWQLWKISLVCREKETQRERRLQSKKRERNNRSHLDKTHLCLLDFLSFLVFLSLVQPFYFYNFNQVHKSSSWISDRPTSSEFKSIKSQLTFDKKNEFNISLQGLVPESTCQMEEEEEDQQCFPIV